MLCCFREEEEKTRGETVFAVLAQVLCGPLNILCISRLIRNIDNVIVYNITGAHVAEVRGGTFRRTLEVV